MTATAGDAQSGLAMLFQLLSEQPLPGSCVRDYAAHRREHAQLTAEIGKLAADAVLRDVIAVESARRQA